MKLLNDIVWWFLHPSLHIVADDINCSMIEVKWVGLQLNRNA